MGVLHLCSIKNIFYDKMDLRLSFFDVVIFSLLKAGFQKSAATFPIQSKTTAAR